MTLTTILFFAFVVIVTIQVTYYFAFLFSFSIKQEDIRLKNQVPLSVIICAKNEAENLKKNLPYIIQQDYNNFEIVLVNDGSTDKTLKIMELFASKHNTIKIVDVKTIEAFWGNKKYALTLGIKASSNNFLVFTDADCKPNSDKWLAHLSSKFSNNNAIVLGYGAYAKKPFSFLNKLIRFETLLTAIQYFSYTKLGMPYMGVGRNLAYRKELFFDNSGFNDHMSIKSGDDDLFINAIANNKNTAICVSRESMTISEPKTTFKDWILQKRRHITTARFYKSKHQILLGLFYISQLTFWIFSGILLLVGYNWPWLIALIICRITIQFFSVGFAAKKLNTIDLLFVTPVLEIFLVFMQLSIFIANLIATPKHWK